MYAFQFEDGTWRIDFFTRSRQPHPTPDTEAYRLYQGIFASRREAEAAIEAVRALMAATPSSSSDLISQTLPLSERA